MQFIFRVLKFCGLFLFWSVTAGNLYAQQQRPDTLRPDSARLQVLKLEGHVVGGVERELLPGAYIYLGEKKVAVMTTDQKGEFLVDRLPVGEIRLTVSYVGYQEFSKIYDLREDLDIGEICLESVILEDVVVEADPPLTVQRGDTTQFNAAALKLRGDAELEDLLKKLPGFEIVDGKIIAHGKEVTKLYIDGIEYAFNDPSAALKNLPASLVAKIKMYDSRNEEAEFSGFDDGQKFRSLNIETYNPDQMKVFGNIRAGYGITDPLKNTFQENNYQGTLSASLFDRKRRITLNGDVQNTGQNNDLPGSRYQGRGGDNNSKSVYVNFSSNQSEKVMLSGNYSYHGSNTYSASLSKQEYFPTDRYENRIYDNENHSWRDMENHYLNLHTTLKLNDKNQISFSSIISAGNNQSRSQSQGSNIENNDTVNISDRVDLSKSDNLNINGRLSWMHAFEKKGRTFTWQMNGDYNRNISDQAQNNQERSWNSENIPADTLRNLLINNHGMTSSWSVGVAWSEPLTEHARLSFNYTYSSNTDGADKGSLSFRDRDFAELTGIDTAQTNELKNIQRRYHYGVQYNYFYKKIRLNGGVKMSQTQIENRYKYLGKADSLVKSRYTDFSPIMSLDFHPAENKTLGLTYNGSSSSPSATMLQDVLDVTDPLQVSKGNPDLKKSYNHGLSLNYSGSKTEKGNFFHSSVHISQTFNQIASNMRFIQQDTVINDYLVVRGARFTSPVNLDGAWSLSANTQYSFGWKKLKLRLNTSVGYNFSHTPSIYDNLKNMTNAHSGNFNLNISTNISEHLDLNLSSSSSYSYSKNSTTGSSRYFNENINSYLYWLFWKNIFISGGYNGRFYVNKKGGKVTQAEHLVNASVGKKFGKQQQLVISLAANDVLKEQNTVNYSLNDLYAQTSYQTRPSSYYMLTLTYRFSNADRQKNRQPK